MNNIYKFLNQKFEKRPQPKVWRFFLLVTLMLGYTLYLTNFSLKNGLYLNASYKNAEYSCAKSYPLVGNDYFRTDNSGKLYWHPKSFIEALLLGTVAGQQSFNIIHVLMLYVLVGVLFFTMKGTNHKKTFSENLYPGFTMIVVFIMVAPSLIGYGQGLVVNYFRDLTGGQFYLQPSNNLASFYCMLGAMLFFLTQFPQQALDMQKEQELTI